MLDILKRSVMDWAQEDNIAVPQHVRFARLTQWPQSAFHHQENAALFDGLSSVSLLKVQSFVTSKALQSTTSLSNVFWAGCPSSAC